MEQRRSNNSGIRYTHISAIVIHDTASKAAEGALEWLCDPKSQVSCHYLIDRDGTIYQLVPEDRVAWHAGISEFLGQPNVNAFSLGIELVDLTNDPYPQEQLDSLIELCRDLCDRYGIPATNVVGHDYVARPQGRKVDPGVDFPWKEFRSALVQAPIHDSLEKVETVKTEIEKKDPPPSTDFIMGGKKT